MAPAYRWAIGVYDRAYRLTHRLDGPAAEVGTVLRVEIRRVVRERCLPDCTTLKPGDRIGILHLNNDRIRTLHLDGLTPMRLGLEFRRLLIGSLQALAADVVEAGRLHDVQAFAAVTIFHQKLTRIGFVLDARDPLWPHLAGAYQRALLASLHPKGALRLSHVTYGKAQRVWLSRGVLLAQFGPGIRRPLRVARVRAYAESP